MIWTSRSHGGHVQHYIGADSRYISKIVNTIKVHGNIRIYPVGDHVFAPVNTARQLTVSHPGLSLNTDVTSATIRAGLAALAAVRGEEESVVQIILGASFMPKPTPKKLPDPNASWLSTILYGVEDAPQETRKSIKEKNEQHCFEACIRLGVSGGGQAGRINSMLSAFRTFEPHYQHQSLGKEDSVSRKSTRGRKMRSDIVRVVPEFREEVDIEKLCRALIEIAKDMSKDKKTNNPKTKE